MESNLKNFSARILERGADFAANPLQESLLIERSGKLAIYYAPFEYVASTARLVIVGITPGRTQMINALRAAHDHLARGTSVSETARLVKSHASFSGAMRSNLVAMIETIGLHRRLGVTEAQQLFNAESALVHFTSALQFPVFLDGEDYRGTPSMVGTPMLRRHLETHMRAQLDQLASDVWFLPLGPSATEGMEHLVRLGWIRSSQMLRGMPHPSGANAERISVFVGRKDPSLASPKTNSARLLSARDLLRAAVQV